VDSALLLSSALWTLSRLSLMSGQIDAGLNVARRNQQLIMALQARQPQGQEVARFSSAARSLLGIALLHAGHADEGLTTLSEGVNAARAQLHKDPENQRVRRDFVAQAATLGEASVVQRRGEQALALCSEARKVSSGSTRALAFDREESSYLSMVERCEAGAWLLHKRPLEALRAIDAGLQRLAATAPTDPGELQALALGLMLRARALQLLGRTDDALSEGRTALAHMKETLRQDSSNSETEAATAYVQTQASLLGARTTLKPDSEQCRWAGQAAATFKNLADHRRLNLEYAADQKQAQERSVQCAQTDRKK
jgi:hypothetical protein